REIRATRSRSSSTAAASAWSASWRAKSSSSVSVIGGARSLAMSRLSRPASLEVLLGGRRHERIGRVHHIADIELARLGQQLVCIQAGPTVIRLEPRHQLPVRDARGVLHGTSAADSHDPIRRFDPRPGYRSALDHLEDEGRLRSYLQRNPTQLTLTLASVSVARVEERALVPDREIDRVAGTDVRHVHVASEGTRRQRADRLKVGGYSQRSHEGVPWQRQSELAAGQDI